VIIFDDSLWPLLKLRFVGAHTSEQFEQYLLRLEAYLRQPGPCMVLLDVNAASVPLDQCRQQAEWMHANQALLREKVLGLAFVSSSTRSRLSLNVILHLKPVPISHTLVPDTRAAAEWAADRFADAGLLLPSVRVRQHFGLRPSGSHPSVSWAPAHR
jgi:hypothetical protein